MSTPAQILASQTNGAKSRGPVTPEGRDRSSRNSCKHGLSSTRVVLAGESQEEWESLLGGFGVGRIEVHVDADRAAIDGDLFD